MNTNRIEPADTRSMGIVHSALRRDLRRARMVLEAPPYPDEPRRRALAAHILWMCLFLHMHHAGEDAGLWPAIRAKDPAAGALLDRMASDHEQIGGAIAVVEDAARAYGDDPSARARLLAAVTGLEDVLLPHLQREELEMMPVVAATITTAEYRAIEKKYFVEPKGFAELGMEAHWIIDGATPEDRDTIVHVVPAVPRFLLLHGFARKYRRQAAVLWGTGPASTVPSLRVAPIEEHS
ncbi:hemerythrin domain-containing protein [Rhodococcus sp. HM1]|uniref:hemerythrin domain-containing protein n=1 Tax=unclassified Rhodococcus (in: high G+C Gram-positive bacteria) TaxID=192944 RepID=UPI0018CEDC39|nr:MULTISPECIES: hemerythrin domain-containing protein [unclassified Rhodococcus (in: high G+C Gram-positive bacteria)]MBH0123100.1 hemerythrin domain-containing protein [Rhodococcus sp. CX]MCK8672643.1 hemerythrin domain-containing protein [Rhodococcus sp. HM1]